MFAATTIADLHLARTRLRVAMLDQWAEAGLALATKVVSESGRSLADAARTLMRIAQAVRLATLLAVRLCNPDNPAFQPVPAKPRAQRSAATEALAEQNPTERISPEQDPAETPARPGRLPFAGDRCSDDAILRRPLVEIVKVICRTLGVTPDWSLWSDEDETTHGSGPAATGASPPAPPPDPGRTIPRPPPRPRLILDRPEPPPIAPLRTRLRSSCAPGALCPVVTPIALPATGGLPLPKA